MSSSMLSSSANPSSSMSVQRALIVTLVLVVCVLSLQRGVSAKPPTFSFQLKNPPGDIAIPENDQNNACHRDGEVEELCQICAKKTKSNVVYPMCCMDLEEAREWCHRYIH